MINRIREVAGRRDDLIEEAERAAQGADEAALLIEDQRAGETVPSE